MCDRDARVEHRDVPEGAGDGKQEAPSRVLAEWRGRGRLGSDGLVARGLELGSAAFAVRDLVAD